MGKYCKYCGVSLSSEAKFCKSCGKALYKTVDIINSKNTVTKYPVLGVITQKVVAPEAVTPKVITPEDNVPEVVASEVEVSEVVASEVVASEVVTSEVVASEIVASEVVASEVVASEVVATKTFTPEIINPITTDLEAIVPEAAAPKATAPQQQIKCNNNKRTIKRPTILRIIAACLLIIIALTAGIKLLPGVFSTFGEQRDRGKLLDKATAEVTVNTPLARAAGVTVDANELNLTQKSQKLTVKRYEQRTGSDGFIGEEYDISLGDRRYLRAPITLTFPYDAAAARDSTVCVLHYDSDYGMWIPQACEVDDSSFTVSIKLTSLSPVRVVYFDKDYDGALYYIENKGHSNAVLKVSYSYWETIKGTPLEPASIVAQDYIMSGSTLSSAQQIINQGGNAVGKLNTYYTLFGAVADTLFTSINTLSTAGGMISNVTDKASKGVAVVSLAIAATQLAFDLANTDPAVPQNQAAVNLYKNFATNAGILYGYCTGYSSVALSAGFLGVAVFGYALDTLVEEAKTIQADTVEAVFDAYYNDISTFTEQDMYNIFVDAYWDAWQNNRESKEGMDLAIKQVKDAIDLHAEEFWNDIYKGGSDALSFAVAEAGVRTYYTPTAAQRAELTSRFKKDLLTRFKENIIPWINDFMLSRMQDALYSALYKAVDPYNVYHTVQIQEVMPDGSEGECKYQMCPIRFGFTEDFVLSDHPEEWELLAPDGKDEWAAKLSFTLLGYLGAGAPDKVFLFDAWDEEKRFGGQIHTETLSLNGEEAGYFTLIDLSPAGGDGPFKAFKAYDKEIETPTMIFFFVGSMIQDSISAADEIEMTSMGSGSYSFTVPAYEIEYTAQYNDYKWSMSSATFKGTMNSDMTSGNFELSGGITSQISWVYYGSEATITKRAENIDISVDIRPHKNLESHLILAFNIKYDEVNDDSSRETVEYEKTFTVIPIR